jgi:hypothetical protein
VIVVVVLTGADHEVCVENATSLSKYKYSIPAVLRLTCTLFV